MYHIYCIFNKVNDKVYIGQTIDRKQRLAQHKSDLKGGRHKNDHLSRAWAVYGEHAFEFFYLDTYDTREEVDNAERTLIAWFKEQGLSYNLADGGCERFSQSEETRQKLRDTHTGVPLVPTHPARQKGRTSPMQGKQHTDKAKAKISAVHKGKPLSEERARKLHEGKRNASVTEETRAKLSESAKGNSNFKGKTHTEETKQKQRETKLGANNPMYGKPHTEDWKRAMSEKMKAMGHKPPQKKGKEL